MLIDSEVANAKLCTQGQQGTQATLTDYQIFSLGSSHRQELYDYETKAIDVEIAACSRFVSNAKLCTQGHWCIQATKTDYHVLVKGHVHGQELQDHAHRR